MKVLYVEDNPANVFLVKRVARMGNHEIINYIDGGQALKKYDEINPDLVLMDIQLAGDKSGLDVVRELRARGVKTTIIAVTAYAMVGDKERCIEAGCDDYLAKPLPIPRLVEIFESHSKRVAQQAPAAVAVAEAPKAEAVAVAEAPKPEIPAVAVTEAPKPETPTVAAVSEAPKAETAVAPVSEAPKAETVVAPATEAPKVETPAAPAAEAPKVEAATPATAVEATPVVEKLRTPTAPLVDPAPEASAAKTGEEAKAADEGKKEETSAKPETSSQG